MVTYVNWSGVCWGWHSASFICSAVKSFQDGHVFCIVLVCCSLALAAKFASFCFCWKFSNSICSFTPKSSCLSGQKVVLYFHNKEKKHNSHLGNLLEDDILEVRAGKELAAILIWNATEYFLKAGSHYFYRPVMSYVLSISLLFWPLLHALLLWSKCFRHSLHSLASAPYHTQLIHRSVTFHSSTGV